MFEASYFASGLWACVSLGGVDLVWIVVVLVVVEENAVVKGRFGMREEEREVNIQISFFFRSRSFLTCLL